MGTSPKMNAAVTSAIPAVKSASAAHAKSRVLNLFKRVLKQTPVIAVNYNITLPTNVLRDRIAYEFRRNADLTDQIMIDRAIFRGEQELDETVKMFKTPTHVWRYIDPEQVRNLGEEERIIGMKENSEFLTSFYANRLSPF